MENPSPTQQKSTTGWTSRLLFAAALLLLLWICTWPLKLPAAVPATAAATSFSAERAMADLQVIADEPHGAGSPAQLQVRDYILEQAAQLGLEAEVQKSGKIENVIVRLPGADSTGSVLITAHYDFHPTAPGAGDDGISVAALVGNARSSRLGFIKIRFHFQQQCRWMGASGYL
jgi:hypothetical protein